MNKNNHKNHNLGQVESWKSVNETHSQALSRKSMNEIHSQEETRKSMKLYHSQVRPIQSIQDEQWNEVNLIRWINDDRVWNYQDYEVINK